jgi:hypothetical protein
VATDKHLDRNPRIRELVDRSLSPAEVRAWLDTPISSAEREEVLALVAWFTRRYPTPIERLAYVRQAYARWSRA